MSLKQRISERAHFSAPPILKEAVFQAAYFAVGFLLSFSCRDYAYSPLGVSLVCACDGKHRISSSVGATLGYIMYCDSINALRYIAAVLCAYILSKLIESFNFSSAAVVMGAIAAFCIFSTGSAMCLAYEKRTSLLFGFGFEAFCAFCAAFLMNGAFRCYLQRRSFLRLSLKEFSLFSFCAVLLLWSLSGFEYYISPARIVLFYLIMLSAFTYFGIGSAVVGSLSFAVFSVLSQGQSMPVCFCIGAFACTVASFSAQSKQLCAVAMLAVNSVCFFLEIPGATALMIESAVAAIAFSLTPKKAIKRIESVISGTFEPIFASAAKKSVSARLKMASAAVNEVGNAVSSAAAGLETSLPSVKAEVFSSVTDMLCRSCGCFEKCWSENREKTLEIFNSMLFILKQNEIIDFQILPPSVKVGCIKCALLAEAFNKSFVQYTVESLIQTAKSEMRHSLTDQFLSVSDILDDINASLDDGSEFDEQMSEKMKVLLYSFDIKARQAVVKTDGNMRLTAEIECEPITNKVERTHLKQRLEELTGRSLETPEIISGETSDYIIVCEKYPLAVEVGTSQISSNGEKMCGDSFETFYDGRGAFDVVLADGMGTGTRAALDSSMAKSLTRRLLESGLTPVGSLRLVNSALIVKSKEESMSSLDVMQVDMFTGKARFFKAGAAPSFVRHRNRIQEINKPALPLGILRRIELSTLEGSVSRGDIAVLVSDGIADCGSEVVKGVLKKNSALTSEKIASLLTAEAEKIKGEKHDDLTAVVCKFH